MSARRIAVLVGSHDPAYFARYTQPNRPSEAAVLTALRTQRSASESNHRAAATYVPAGQGRSIARHASIRAGSRTSRGMCPAQVARLASVRSSPACAREG